FTVNALCAAGYGVPSVFLAGDAGICGEARAMVPGLRAVETLEGKGLSTTSISPAWSRRLIREGVAEALSGDFTQALPAKSERYEVVIEFSNPTGAYRASWYPGARRHGPRAIAFAHADFAEILRALVFLKV